jgi:hypothetical protein
VRSLALLLVVIAGCGPSVRDVLHRTAQCDEHGRAGCWVALARETIPPPSVGRTRSIEDIRRDVVASGVHTEAPTCYECACPAQHADGCRAHVVYAVPAVEDEAPQLWDRGFRPVEEVVATCADANSVVECPFSSDATTTTTTRTAGPTEAPMPVRAPVQTPPPPPVQTPMPTTTTTTMPTATPTAPPTPIH